MLACFFSASVCAPRVCVCVHCEALQTQSMPDALFKRRYSLAEPAEYMDYKDVIPLQNLPNKWIIRMLFHCRTCRLRGLEGCYSIAEPAGYVDQKDVISLQNLPDTWIRRMLFRCRTCRIRGLEECYSIAEPAGFLNQKDVILLQNLPDFDQNNDSPLQNLRDQKDVVPAKNMPDAWLKKYVISVDIMPATWLKRMLLLQKRKLVKAFSTHLSVSRQHGSSSHCTLEDGGCCSN